MMKLSEKCALLIIDCQNDFCDGGTLAVPQSSLIFPIINRLQKLFKHVIASKDWHPADHISFASNHPGSKVGDLIEEQGEKHQLWPIHCVQYSYGAEFSPALDLGNIQTVIFKGTHSDLDSYSAFFDNAHLRSTGLTDYLRQCAISDVYIVGLAIEYCVKFTALDAAALGFNTTVIMDACKGVELRQGDITSAYQQMEAFGVSLVNSNELITQYSDH